MIVYSKVSTAPEAFPVTLDEAKAHLRVDGTTDDLYISSLIQSATRVCESYAGLSFITQTRTVKLDYFNGSDVVLPYGPVTAITSIDYMDEDDEAATVDSGDYTLDTQSGLSKVRVTESWPYTNGSLNNVVITYTAGYGAAGSVPIEAKQAILMRVAHYYQNRGDEKTGEDTGWMDLLDCIKVYWNAEY